MNAKRVMVLVPVRTVGMLAFALVMAGGCSSPLAHRPTNQQPQDDQGEQRQLVKDSASPSSPPTPKAGPSSGTPSASNVPDGKNAAFLTRVDTSAKTVTFDVVQFLSDDAATEAYNRDHPGETEGPPEGYYIVNDNPQLRTVPVSPQVQVKVVDFDAPDAATKTIKFADLPRFFANNSQYKPNPGEKRLATNPFWVTVSHGQITVIEEQYLP
jgi:hypothetical protein